MNDNNHHPVMITMSTKNKMIKSKSSNPYNNNNRKQPKWIIHNCPPSLMFLVKFYRFFSYSFSGIVFVSDNHHDNDDNDNHEEQNNNNNNENYYCWLIFKHYFYLTLTWLAILSNIIALIANLYREYLKDMHRLPIGSIIFMKNTNFNNTLFYHRYHWTNNNNNTMMNDNDNDNDNNNQTQLWYQLLQLGFFGSDDEDYIETINLKSILRNIIKLLLIVSIIEMITILLYFLTSGGHIIRLLMKIPYIYDFDYSKQFSFISLIIILIISTIISMIGYISFRSPMIKQIIDPNILLTIKIHRLSELSMLIFGLIFLSLVPILFIYTMMLFRFAINQLMNTYAITNKLDETNMVKLKTKLSDLNDQFKEIIPCFSIPLTITLSSSIFTVISSACFLMIYNANNSNNLYVAFVCSLGIFSFIRLIILASFGNLPTNICHDLIRTVYENLEHWSLHEWMCFMELKRLRKEFIVSIFSMYTVRQSSIMAMLGFALNYIVILLQTENFSTGNDNNNNNN